MVSVFTHLPDTKEGPGPWGVISTAASGVWLPFKDELPGRSLTGLQPYQGPGFRRSGPSFLVRPAQATTPLVLSPSHRHG